MSSITTPKELYDDITSKSNSKIKSKSNSNSNNNSNNDIPATLIPTEDSDSCSSPGILTPAGSGFDDPENSLEMLKLAYSNFSNEVDTLKSDLIYYKLQASRHRVKYLDLKERHMIMVAAWEADKEKMKELERSLSEIEDKVKMQKLARQLVLTKEYLRKHEAEGKFNVMENMTRYKAKILEGELAARKAKLRKFIMAFVVIFGVVLALLMNCYRP